MASSPRKSGATSATSPKNDSPKGSGKCRGGSGCACASESCSPPSRSRTLDAELIRVLSGANASELLRSLLEQLQRPDGSTRFQIFADVAAGADGDTAAVVVTRREPGQPVEVLIEKRLQPMDFRGRGASGVSHLDDRTLDAIERAHRRMMLEWKAREQERLMNDERRRW